MPKQVYVYYPGSSMHGKVIAVKDDNYFLTVDYYSKIKMSKDNDESYNATFEISQETLIIRPAQFDGIKIFIAYKFEHKPSVADIYALWPEFKPNYYELKYWYDAPYLRYVIKYKQETYLIADEMLRQLNMTIEDYIKHAFKVEQSFNYKGFNYKEKAASEFEGVEELDPTLWEGSNGLD